MIYEFRLGMGVDSVKLCCKFCYNDLNVFKNLRTSILWIKVSYSHLQQLMYKGDQFQLNVNLSISKSTIWKKYFKLYRLDPKSASNQWIFFSFLYNYLSVNDR